MSHVDLGGRTVLSFGESHSGVSADTHACGVDFVNAFLDKRPDTPAVSGRE